MTTKKELEKSYATMSNWSLILGILSWLVLGIVLAPASFILGVKAQKSEASSTRVTATIGMIVSGIGLAYVIVCFVIAMAAVAAWR